MTLKLQDFYVIYPEYIIIFLLKLQLCVSLEDYKVKFLMRKVSYGRGYKDLLHTQHKLDLFCKSPTSLHQTTSALSPILQVKLHSHILLLCVSVVALVLLWQG